MLALCLVEAQSSNRQPSFFLEKYKKYCLNLMLRKRYLREKLIFYFPSEKLNFASSHVLNTGTNVYIYHGQSRSYAILLANAASQRAQDKAYSDFF